MQDDEKDECHVQEFKEALYHMIPENAKQRTNCVLIPKSIPCCM
jgi:hypothetical protein